MTPFDSALPLLPVEHEKAPAHADTRSGRIFAAAQLLLGHLSKGEALGAPILRAAMQQAFGSSDSAGAWNWKDAYEATEVAQVLFLKTFGKAMAAKAGHPLPFLRLLTKLVRLIPTHTKRSEQSVELQQFSTPLELAFVASHAAALCPGDVVLEPSAGTGMLAIFAALKGANVFLNEIADERAGLLTRAFETPIARHDAEHIDDLLPRGLQPSVVLMNPPFSSGLHLHSNDSTVGFRHLQSAYGRLATGGRLVAITQAALHPAEPCFAKEYKALLENAALRFTAPLAGRFFARHGTQIDTRLTVIDKTCADEEPYAHPLPVETAEELLQLLDRNLPQRVACARQSHTPTAPATRRHAGSKPAPSTTAPPAPVCDTGFELTYETCEGVPQGKDGFHDALYEEYRVERIVIADARPHPTKLVQSAAMASVSLPKPSYRPHLPSHLIANGVLSDAQLETIIYAGEAHSGHLAGFWSVNEHDDTLTPVNGQQNGAVQFRRGFFLGDGTGAGKGRQVAGVILDNVLKGRRRAIWISKSETLLEDARRDWSALGQEPLLIQPLSRFKPGQAISLREGILFVTYATLRGEDRAGLKTRLQQIIDWAGRDFEGVIVFDESHAMANAAGADGSRGREKPSQQGLAGLKLQHALSNARVLYVSATGATQIENLAYAQRLGLWGSSDFPFASRTDLLKAMHAGGIAAMEVLARDLKALGLYMARSLSYDGLEVDIVEHALTSEQRRIYDAYADAFKVIHNHLGAALEATGVTQDGKALNARAKSAARSAFESNKQRFFNHLITAMKVPSLIRAIERDLDEGRAALIQLVSTGEALTERRLAQIPPSEWNDITVDVTPREYVLDYLTHAFPVHLYERYQDEEGNIASRLVMQDGQPVINRDAERLRDALIEQLLLLPPVQSALDQIIHHFGEDKVAEITGRSRRIVKKSDPVRGVFFKVETRPGSANLDETASFQNDAKRILVFSDAGGTGRSYHADRSIRNQRKRCHYVIEPGWRADAAIQGLGRSNRTNQVAPPIFRPVTSNVRGEKRFLSTIARRLDSLGAITRGQRQTGGQGLFRSEDNLESDYARDALHQFYRLVVRGGIAAITLADFEEWTGLALVTEDGLLIENPPPITTFLNRLLALPITLQNALFASFEQILDDIIEDAKAAGIYEAGIETILAKSITIAERHVIATHPATGAETLLYKLTRKDTPQPLTWEGVTAYREERGGGLLVNERSGHAALLVKTNPLTTETGEVRPRVRLIKPMNAVSMLEDEFANTHWRHAKPDAFYAAWQREIDALPELIETRLYLVGGLLLPIWKALPNKAARIFRLKTDDGQKLIGRVIEEDAAATLLDSYGNTAATPEPQRLFELLCEGKTQLRFANGRILKQSLVMHQPRIEFLGAAPDEVPFLRTLGVFSEIITYQLRLFIPRSAEGIRVLERLLERNGSPRIECRAGGIQ